MSHQTAKMLLTGDSGSALASDLSGLFKCRVCNDFILPPILQCQKGHLLCDNCRPRLTLCPTCRDPLGSIRNLAMEKVARLAFHPCKYAPLGCEVRLPQQKQAEHEELCEFRPKSCSCSCTGTFCMWRGSLNAVMPHILNEHKSVTRLQGEDIVFRAIGIDLPEAANWEMMQSCFGCHFLLLLMKQTRRDQPLFYAIVELIGTRKQAERFTYRLQLNGHQHPLIWEATPRSIHEGVSNAIVNCDCLVFDTSVAQLFAENGTLCIDVSISMN